MDNDTAVRLSLSDRFSRAAQWTSQQCGRAFSTNRGQDVAHTGVDVLWRFAPLFYEAGEIRLEGRIGKAEVAHRRASLTTPGQKRHGRLGIEHGRLAHLDQRLQVAAVIHLAAAKDPARIPNLALIGTIEVVPGRRDELLALLIDAKDLKQARRPCSIQNATRAGLTSEVRPVYVSLLSLRPRTDAHLFALASGDADTRSAE